jgi:hypothetical protein
MSSLFSMLIPVLIGFCLVRICIPADKYWCRHDWLRLSLGVGVGFGVCSCALFTWLLTYGRTSPLYILVELSLALVLAFAAVRRSTGCCLCGAQADRESPGGRSQKVFFLCFLTLFACACLSYWLQSRTYPQGQWDAWAIWNLRARFLFRAGDQWRMAFSSKQLWSHPDYPLLVPAMVVRTWIYTGTEQLAAPMQIAALFTFATVGVLVSGLYVITGLEKALVSGIVLLGTASFIKLGTLQSADIGICYFILAALVLLQLEERLPTSAILLTGTVAGLAAWTKNEGLLFFVLFLVARKITRRPILSFLLGALFVLVLVAVFKTTLVPSNYLFRQESGGLLADVRDPSRYLLIVVGFVYQILKFGGLHPNPLIGLAAAFALAGAKGRPGARTAALILAGVSGGFFLTYLITPFDLAWHIGSSLDRLLLQLWPAALLILFMILELPPTRLPQMTSVRRSVGRERLESDASLGALAPFTREQD